MTIQRLEHVGIVVDDLEAATAFFVELGLKLQGEGQVEDGWVDRVVGLQGVRVEYAMVETPDGHGRLELVKFHSPWPGRRRARAGEHPGHPPCRIRCRRHRRRRRHRASPRRRARWRGGELRRHLPALLCPRPGGDHRRAGAADRLLRSAALGDEAYHVARGEEGTRDPAVELALSVESHDCGLGSQAGALSRAPASANTP
jgi:catechol 2,3-dioxygenase-like lactoylglutathione lyase family enzyme